MNIEYAEWLAEELNLSDGLNYLFGLSCYCNEIEEDAEKEFNFVTGGI